ncbi:protein FANTASTIC FOUR 3 [Humulus lupulus]|uniref:protein FANTASTIC FOUR 3 n=1 Tax=Humulus lupulus TaxID=3486 RepID=UPI002B415BA5|nr:protein FANTASTIC FOUR 3 [Humulus lupulus]
MAACGSLQHIFEKPLPENPTLLESLSPWNQIKPVNKPNIDQSSFTEIFGELHFKESSSLLSSSSSSSASSSSSSVIDLDSKSKKTSSPFENSFSSSSKYTSSHKKSDSFSLKSFESLQLCTEGLGFESSGEVDDLMLKNNNNNNSIKEEDDDDDDHNKDEGQKPVEKELSVGENSTNFSEMVQRSRRMTAMTTTTATATGGGRFPPPISCLSKSNGKPWICFKSYRQDGRFVLKEVRVQSQEFLHACREDGRLKLHFVQPKNEIVEDEDGENEEEEDEEEEDDDDEQEESGKDVADEDSENVRSELGHTTDE